MRNETELDQVGMLLRDQPLGTAADINEYTIAFWNGRELIWAWLRDDGSSLLEEEFDLDLDRWEELAGDVEAWLAAPRYSVRPEILGWVKNSPPHESGA